MNKIIKPQKYYTQISNNILINQDISLKAKGLYAYLISKPENYDLSSVRIANECKEGVKAIQSALREIEDRGYLHRIKKPNGRIDYHFFNSPDEKVDFLNSLKDSVPECQRASEPVSLNGLLGDINNTEYKQDYIINNTSLSTAQPENIDNLDWKSEIINHSLFEISKERGFSNLDEKDIDYTLDLYKASLTNGRRPHFTQALSWLKNVSLDKIKTEKIKTNASIKPYSNNYKKSETSYYKHDDSVYDIKPTLV